MISQLTSPTKATDAKRLGLPDIAFVGKAGSGKSTAAGLLGELGYSRMSFAAPLKRMAGDLWGAAAVVDRDKLQKLGVAVREIASDTWVDLLIERRRAANDRAPVVVDDLRFPNEWDALKAEGFVIVRVLAGEARRVDRLKANGKWQHEDQLTHESETAVDHLGADHTIYNEHSKDDFWDALVEIILRERRRR